MKEDTIRALRKKVRTDCRGRLAPGRRAFCWGSCRIRRDMCPKVAWFVVVSAQVCAGASGSFVSLTFISLRPSSSHGTPCEAARTTQTVSGSRSFPTCFATSAPHKRCRIIIPSSCHRFQRSHHLLRRLKTPAGQSATNDNTLNGLAQIQPARSRRRELPESGVNKTVTPCRISQTNSSAFQCPVKLSQISSMRNGGRAEESSENLTVSPSCQCSQSARCR